jgi:hypothetical protein
MSRWCWRMTTGVTAMGDESNQAISPIKALLEA